MSILSTNKKLINIGKEYSAGSGIDITNDVISVIGNTVPYSAGENIDIQDFVISSKDWSNDITDASANAYNETTAWVHDNYTNSADVSFLSAEVDKKLDSSAWEAVSGSLATEDYVILSDNLTYARATAFATSQGYAKESACNSAFDYLNENKLDSSAFDLPNSGHWNEATNVVEGNSAAWFDNVGDVEVNNWVYNNSASTEDTTNVVETNSGSWNTVSDKLDVTAFTNWQDGQYATDLQTIEGQISNKLDTSSFSEVSGSFLTAINIPESATWNDVSTTVQSNSAQWSDNTGDEEVNSFVYDNSAAIIDVDTTYQENSASYLTAHQDISNKLDTTAFSTVSGDFLTAHQSLDGYATEDWVTAQGYITGVDLSEYAKTSSVLDYIDSACSSKLDTTSFSNVSGDFLTTSFGISESAHWEEATTAYEQNSGTYLTSHQDISDLMPKSESANFYPMTGNPSGFLTTHQDLSDYQTIEGMTAYQPVGDYYSASNPSGFITGVDLTPYATIAEVDTLSSMLSGAIDYVSANASGGSSVISSFTSAWTNLVPPYGDYVINSLNGKYISAFLSNSADKASNANNANSANSAGYAQTVNVANVENLGFVRNLSSEYGTIYVTHNNLIDSTNSAISRTGYEGFVSSFQDKSIGPTVTANFSWDKSLPNTTFNFTEIYASNNTTISYSANTNLTGEVTVTSFGEIPFSVDVPNATELNVWSNDWIQIKNNVASAADTFETVVGELAWASALPSYEYNSTNKISAINGSAIAAGDEFPASANEAITAYQNASGTYLTAISIPESATWNDVSTTVQTNSADWGQGGSVTLPISGTNGYFSANLDTTGLSINTEDGYDASYGYRVTVSHNSEHVQIGHNYIEISDGGQESIDVQTIRDLTSISSTVSTNSASWNEVSTTVQTNSASWNDVSSKQDNLTFGYDGQDKISAINNSAIAGVGSLDIFPISGTGAVDVYEQNSVLWISGKDFTSDISYISGTIGNVETLLASL